MYEAKKARIDEMRRRFDRQLGERSPEVQGTAREYLEALTDLVESFNDGPGGDPRIVGHDTTGELNRIEDQVKWAEDERRRVRRSLQEIL